MENAFVYYTITRERETELLYDWQFMANQFDLAPSPLRLTTSDFYFQLNACGHSPYVTSSLTKSFSGQIPAGLITIF
jgi:hypothetical protein